MRDQVGDIEFLGSFFEELPDTGLPEIAFAGRSNVGKSTALNALMQRKSLARTSRRPGRTQAINLFRIGQACVFADLPGYGFAKVPDRVQERWKAIIEAYLGDRPQLVLVVVLVDARHDAQNLDRQLIEGLYEADIPFCVVATKADKLSRNQQQKQLARLRKQFGLPAGLPLPFSGMTAEGRDRIWDVIEAAVEEA